MPALALLERLVQLLLRVLHHRPRVRHRLLQLVDQLAPDRALLVDRPRHLLQHRHLPVQLVHLVVHVKVRGHLELDVPGGRRPAHAERRPGPRRQAALGVRAPEAAHRPRASLDPRLDGSMAPSSRLLVVSARDSNVLFLSVLSNCQNLRNSDLTHHHRPRSIDPPGERHGGHRRGFQGQADRP